jgi:hypothetical protein
MNVFGIRRVRAILLSVATLTVGIPMGAGLFASPASATTTAVGCATSSLIADINAAASGDTLVLSAACTYTLTTANNTSLGDSGLPVISNTLTINGNGATITRSSAAADFDIVNVDNTGNLTLNDLTISNGHGNSSDPSGGILNRGNLTINNSRISGNSSVLIGGGVVNTTTGTLAINQSTISGNSAGGSAVSACQGGGALIEGPATISASTFSGNSVGTGCAAGTGGAVTIAAVVSSLMVNITNSTFSGNTATTSGGAVELEAGGGPLTVSITSSTIANNTAPSGRGGGIYNVAATVSLLSSILADNSTGGDCQAASGGTITDGGFNDADDTSCFTAGLPNARGTLSGSADIGTLSLAANGSNGPETEAITTSSSAFELVPTPCPTSADERADPRPGIFGQQCDAGAYEFQRAPPTIAKSFAASSVVDGSSTALTFTLGNEAENSDALAGVAFTDTLPAGLEVSTPNGLTGPCGVDGGATLPTAVAGSTSVSLIGASLDPGETCTFSVNVTGTSVGMKHNSVTVSSTNGGVGNTSAADLTVTPAHLIVTAPSPTTTFGTIPTLTPTYQGFVNGDTPASLSTPPTCVTSATTNSPPGVYPVHCSGAVDPDYTFTYLPGTLTIVKAPTTFTIADLLTRHGKDTTAVLGELGLPSNAVGTVLFETGSGLACAIQLTGRPGEATTCFADFGSNVPFTITGIFFDTDGRYLNSDSTNQLHPHG